MIPTPNIDAMKALLASDPVRSTGDNRKPVRKVIDENAELFRQLADRGHTADKVVAGFLVDFPELRESRPDLDDDDYHGHVRDSYISFRRALGVAKPKTSQTKRFARPKFKAVEGKSKAGPEMVREPVRVTESEPVKVPEKPAEKPVAVKPSTKGYPVPKGRTF